MALIAFAVGIQERAGWREGPAAKKCHGPARPGHPRASGAANARRGGIDLESLSCTSGAIQPAPFKWRCVTGDVIGFLIRRREPGMRSTRPATWSGTTAPPRLRQPFAHYFSRRVCPVDGTNYYLGSRHGHCAGPNWFCTARVRLAFVKTRRISAKTIHIQPYHTCISSFSDSTKMLSQNCMSVHY